jgi:hypothetical protein
VCTIVSAPKSLSESKRFSVSVGYTFLEVKSARLSKFRKGVGSKRLLRRVRANIVATSDFSDGCKAACTFGTDKVGAKKWNWMRCCICGIGESRYVDARETYPCVIA